MPITSTPDRQLHLVNTCCHGVIKPADIEHYQATVWHDPTIAGYNELWDFSDADCSGIEYGDLISIAEKAEKLYIFSPDSKFAFLVHTSHQ